MRLSVYLSVLAFAAAATPIGCSLLTPLGDLASEDPPASSGADGGSASDAPGVPTDGAATDSAATDSAATDATLSENLHGYGTFEQGCAPWYSYQSTESQDTVAHGGALSCRFCATAGTDYFAADDKGFLTNPAPGTYRAEAWVRQVAGKVVPTGVEIILRTMVGTSSFPEEGSSPPITVSITWTRIEAELTVTKPADKLNVVVGSITSTNACFLVDDVRVFRVR